MNKSTYLSLLTVFVICVSCGLAQAETRTWTSSVGNSQVEAELIRVEGSTVYLRLSNGKTAKAQIGKLVKQDQEYIQQWQADKGEGSQPDKGKSSKDGGKLPVPNKTDQSKAKTLVKEIYGETIEGARSPAEKRALAAQLFKEAEKLGAESPVERYVMLNAAAKLAAIGGDAEQVLRIFNLLGARYQMETLNQKQALVARCERAATTAELRLAFVRAALETIDDLVKAHRYDSAVTLAESARKAASKTKDRQLSGRATERLTQLRRLQKMSAAYETALSAIKSDPEDAEANLTAGKFQCLVLGDWDQGATYLKKGASVAFQQAAELDASRPQKVEDQTKAGDRWWALAKKEEGDFLKLKLKSRAVKWYRMSLAKTSGLSKRKIELRLEEYAKLAGKPAPPDKKPQAAAIADTKNSDKKKEHEPEQSIAVIDKDTERNPPGPLSPISGGLREELFNDTGPKGSVLVGFRVTFHAAFGGLHIGSIQPVYRMRNGKLIFGDLRGVQQGKPKTFMAKKGYAVGGMIARSGLWVAGFELVYMRHKRNALNSNDAYKSGWIGHNQGGSLKTLNGRGRAVIGIHGSNGKKVVNGIGLIVSP